MCMWHTGGGQKMTRSSCFPFPPYGVPGTKPGSLGLAEALPSHLTGPSLASPRRVENVRVLPLVLHTSPTFN